MASRMSSSLLPRFGSRSAPDSLMESYSRPGSFAACDDAAALISPDELISQVQELQALLKEDESELSACSSSMLPQSSIMSEEELERQSLELLLSLLPLLNSTQLNPASTRPLLPTQQQQQQQQHVSCATEKNYPTPELNGWQALTTNMAAQQQLEDEVLSALSAAPLNTLSRSTTHKASETAPKISASSSFQKSRSLRLTIPGLPNLVGIDSPELSPLSNLSNPISPNDSPLSPPTHLADPFAFLCSNEPLPSASGGTSPSHRLLSVPSSPFSCGSPPAKPIKHEPRVCSSPAASPLAPHFSIPSTASDDAALPSYCASPTCYSSPPSSLPPSPSASLLDDGFCWRKYGQKPAKGAHFPRSYYRCAVAGCPARKTVELAGDGQATEIIYREDHNHMPGQRGGRRKAGGERDVGPGSEVALQDGAAVESTARRGNEAVGFAGGKDGDVHMRESSSMGGMGGEGLQRRLSGLKASLSRLKSRLSGEEQSTSCESKEVPPAKRERSVDLEKEPEIAAVKRVKVEEGCEHKALEKTIMLIESDKDEVNDGYRWRKYGEKVIKNSQHKRNYYRCSKDGCHVKRVLERSMEEPHVLIATYEGNHTHSRPIVARVLHCQGQIQIHGPLVPPLSSQL